MRVHGVSSWDIHKFRHSQRKRRHESLNNPRREPRHDSNRGMNELEVLEHEERLGTAPRILAGNDLVENWLLSLNQSHSGSPGAKAHEGRLYGGARSPIQDYATDTDDSFSRSPQNPPRAFQDTDQQHSRARSMTLSSSISMRDSRQRKQRRDATLLHGHTSAKRAHQGRENELHEEYRDEASKGYSSSTSPCFEKGPRHKTRKDKYDHKGRNRHPTRDEHVGCKKRKIGKGSKGRVVTSSKKVMEIFKSDVVRNKRITMPYGNTMISTPLLDLACSDMKFLRGRDYNTQRMPLSQRRSKKAEKKNKEVEQVSSYFDQAKSKDTAECAGTDMCKTYTWRKGDPISAKTSAQPQYSEQLRQGSIEEPTEPRKVPATNQPSRSCTSEKTVCCTQSRSASRSSSSSQLEDTSQGSSPTKARLPSPSGSAASALRATGVFRSTGITGFDDGTNGNTKLTKTNHDKSCDQTGNGQSQAHCIKNQAPPSVKRQVLYRNCGMMTEDFPCSAEEETSQRQGITDGDNQISQEAETARTFEGEISLKRSSLKNAQATRRSVLDHTASRRSCCEVLNEADVLRSKSPNAHELQPLEKYDEEVNFVSQEGQDPSRSRPWIELEMASATSREAMPPPPLPPPPPPLPLPFQRDSENSLLKQSVSSDSHHEYQRAISIPSSQPSNKSREIRRLANHQQYGEPNNFSTLNTGRSKRFFSSSTSWITQPRNPAVLVPHNNGNSGNNKFDRPSVGHLLEPERDMGLHDDGCHVMTNEMAEFIERIERDAEEVLVLGDNTHAVHDPISLGEDVAPDQFGTGIDLTFNTTHESDKGPGRYGFSYDWPYQQLLFGEPANLHRDGAQQLRDFDQVHGSKSQGIIDETNRERSVFWRANHML